MHNLRHVRRREILFTIGFFNARTADAGAAAEIFGYARE
jgi:hypothetical protein